jgi:RNA polymerase sigma factor (sigma-70 family)
MFACAARGTSIMMMRRSHGKSNMTERRLGNVVHYIRKLGTADGTLVPDRELLRRFVRRQDEAAFAALVERHQAMVMDVCWRVLGRSHDAEDAFQATFLILVRRAKSVRGSVGGWLHAVAYRVACRLRARRARGPAQQLEALEVPQPDNTTEVSWREVRQVLDEELNRLPEKYRAPLVLCYLEGLTQDEAARRLGWSHGVLRGRIDRGRERLRARLTRRGLALSTAPLGAVLAGSDPGRAMSAALVVTTLQATLQIGAGRAAAPGQLASEVVALAEEVTQAMFLKVRITAVAMLVILASASAVLGYQAFAGQRADNDAKGLPQPAAPAVQEAAKLTAEKNTPIAVATLSDVGEFADPEDTLELSVGQMCLLVFKEEPKALRLNGTTRVRSDRGTSTINFLSYDSISPTQLVVGGLQPGTTTWEIWFDAPLRARRDQVLILRIRVLRKDKHPAEKPAGSQSSARYARKDIHLQETIRLKEGEDRLMLLKQKPKKLFILDTSIAIGDANPARAFRIHGQRQGETSMILWFPDKDDKGTDKIFAASILVVE